MGLDANMGQKIVIKIPPAKSIKLQRPETRDGPATVVRAPAPPGARDPERQDSGPAWVFISRHQPALFVNGETLPLSSDHEFVIGRDPDSCNIVISDERVSRQHAAIYSRGGRYFIKDLGSANGTFVNKERTSGPIGLLPGDEIIVPPQKFLFVLFDQFMSSSSSVAPVKERQSHFSGLLHALRIPDLIQTLHSTQQTGILTIMDTNGKTAKLYLAKGEIIAATYKGKSAEEAVYATIGIRDGQFEFVNEANLTVARTVKTGTIAMLLEGTRQEDEAAHLGTLETQTLNASVDNWPTPPEPTR